ncbi:MAG: beta-N-acetylhexosaminidase [Clostridiales bacterium]|nr:beta-N-acetylhexosaminidase [Clostridiales bacterium]
MGKIFNSKKKHFSDEDEDIEDDEMDDDMEDDEEADEETAVSDEVEAEDGETSEDDNAEDSNADDEVDEIEASDDEDGDHEEMSLEEESEEERRYNRRKRRIKNQIIAYACMTLVLAALVVAGVFVGYQVSDTIKLMKQEKESVAQEEQQQQQEEEALQEQEEEPQPDLVIETPEEVFVEPTREEQLDEIANKCIAEMPLEDKVASLFIITPEALTGARTVTKAGEATQEALNKYAVGGLVYFSHNILDKEQVTEMLANTALNSKYPIFLAVDEEGGSVSRIANSNIDVVKVDEMAVIGTSQDTVAAHEAGNTIGTYLSELGFNLDFAPVADVVLDAENSSIGNRSFGTDPIVVATMVSSVVEGMQATGVNACLKHFPGLGSANEDTHDGRVETTRTLEEMQNSDFLPFQAGIEAGADIIMVGHIVASSVDTENIPSSLSKVMITNVLRGDLGFDGVVITDALDMKAISDYYTADEAAIMAIEAGADMLLMPEDFETAYNGLFAAVEEGRISEERIDESLRRIYRIKYADKLE